MNRKRSLILFVIGLTLAVSVGIANAQGPTGTGQPRGLAGMGFTYQGQLKNNGAAVNGTCNFQFGLWADSTSLLTQIGVTVTVPGVSVSNGLFTTPIDFGTNAFNGDARYLGIAVACPSGSYTTFASRQALTPAPVAFALPGLYTQQNAVSPNVIGGYSGNTVTAGVLGATIGGGGASTSLNRVTDDYGTVGGGYGNQAGDNAGTTIDKRYATVGGGYGNTARYSFATVGGGWYNTASGNVATVDGGSSNIASGTGAFVGGGGFDSVNYAGNQAIGNASTIGGGLGNSIPVNGAYAMVGGGYYNIASGSYATVGGGGSNNANGDSATVSGGGSNTASGAGAFVGGGGWNGSGGNGNEALATASTIAGGFGNKITTTASYAMIGGGVDNHASGFKSTVAGGESNTASGDTATIGGGWNNTASKQSATVPGGSSANASHYGEMAYASGSFAANGDAQTSLYVVRNTTTTATQTELFLDGAAQRITIASGRTVTFDILVVARTNGGTSVGYRIAGVIENQGGTTAFVGGTPATNPLGADAAAAAWAVVVAADNANDALEVKVTGAAATNIGWVASVRTVEVSY